LAHRGLLLALRSAHIPPQVARFANFRPTPISLQHAVLLAAESRTQLYRNFSERIRRATAGEIRLFVTAFVDGMRTPQQENAMQ